MHPVNAPRNLQALSDKQTTLTPKIFQVSLNPPQAARLSKLLSYQCLGSSNSTMITYKLITDYLRATFQDAHFYFGQESGSYFAAGALNLDIFSICAYVPGYERNSQALCALFKSAMDLFIKTYAVNVEGDFFYLPDNTGFAYRIQDLNIELYTHADRCYSLSTTDGFQVAVDGSWMRCVDGYNFCGELSGFITAAENAMTRSHFVEHPERVPDLILKYVDTITLGNKVFINGSLASIVDEAHKEKGFDFKFDTHLYYRFMQNTLAKAIYLMNYCSVLVDNQCGRSSFVFRHLSLEDTGKLLSLLHLFILEQFITNEKSAAPIFDEKTRLMEFFSFNCEGRLQCLYVNRSVDEILANGIDALSLLDESAETKREIQNALSKFGCNVSLIEVGVEGLGKYFEGLKLMPKWIQHFAVTAPKKPLVDEEKKNESHSEAFRASDIALSVISNQPSSNHLPTQSSSDMSTQSLPEQVRDTTPEVESVHAAIPNPPIPPLLNPPILSSPNTSVLKKASLTKTSDSTKAKREFKKSESKASLDTVSNVSASALPSHSVKPRVSSSLSATSQPKQDSSVYRILQRPDAKTKSPVSNKETVRPTAKAAPTAENKPAAKSQKSVSQPEAQVKKETPVNTKKEESKKKEPSIESKRAEDVPVVVKLDDLVNNFKKQWEAFSKKQSSTSKEQTWNQYLTALDQLLSKKPEKEFRVEVIKAVSDHIGKILISSRWQSFVRAESLLTRFKSLNPNLEERGEVAQRFVKAYSSFDMKQLKSEERGLFFNKLTGYLEDYFTCIRQGYQTNNFSTFPNVFKKLLESQDSQSIQKIFALFQHNYSLLLADSKNHPHIVTSSLSFFSYCLENEKKGQQFITMALGGIDELLSLPFLNLRTVEKQVLETLAGFVTIDQVADKYLSILTRFEGSLKIMGVEPIIKALFDKRREGAILRAWNIIDQCSDKGVETSNALLSTQLEQLPENCFSKPVLEASLRHIQSLFALLKESRFSDDRLIQSISIQIYNLRRFFSRAEPLDCFSEILKIIQSYDVQNAELLPIFQQLITLFPDVDPKNSILRRLKMGPLLHQLLPKDKKDLMKPYVDHINLAVTLFVHECKKGNVAISSMMEHAELILPFYHIFDHIRANSFFTFVYTTTTTPDGKNWKLLSRLIQRGVELGNYGSTDKEVEDHRNSLISMFLESGKAPFIDDFKILFLHFKQLQQLFEDPRSKMEWYKYLCVPFETLAKQFLLQQIWNFDEEAYKLFEEVLNKQLELAKKDEERSTELDSILIKVFSPFIRKVFIFNSIINKVLPKKGENFNSKKILKLLVDDKEALITSFKKEESFLSADAAMQKLVLGEFNQLHHLSDHYKPEILNGYSQTFKKNIDVFEYWYSRFESHSKLNAQLKPIQTGLVQKLKKMSQLIAISPEEGKDKGFDREESKSKSATAPSKKSLPVVAYGVIPQSATETSAPAQATPALQQLEQAWTGTFSISEEQTEKSYKAYFDLLTKLLSEKSVPKEILENVLGHVNSAFDSVQPTETLFGKQSKQLQGIAKNIECFLRLLEPFFQASEPLDVFKYFVDNILNDNLKNIPELTPSFQILIKALPDILGWQRSLGWIVEVVPKLYECMPQEQKEEMRLVMLEMLEYHHSVLPKEQMKKSELKIFMEQEKILMPYYALFNRHLGFTVLSSTFIQLKESTGKHWASMQNLLNCANTAKLFKKTDREDNLDLVTRLSTKHTLLWELLCQMLYVEKPEIGLFKVAFSRMEEMLQLFNGPHKEHFKGRYRSEFNSLFCDIIWKFLSQVSEKSEDVLILFSKVFKLHLESYKEIPEVFNQPGLMYKKNLHSLIKDAEPYLSPEIFAEIGESLKGIEAK